MKIAMALLLVAFAASAHAELLAPKGAKGQLKVEYVFVSSGGYTAPAKDVITKWRVRRVVDITAQYAADAPAAVGTLHTGDTAGVESRTKNAAKKMEPMAMDMYAVAAKCGVSLESGNDITKAQEACIEKGVSDYGNNMQMTDIESARADVAAVNETMKSKRFQLWQITSQSGTYQVDEEHHRQVFEMTCTAAKTCKRSDVRKGGGPIPTPPGAKSGAGFSLLEVDTVNKDMVIVLPVPLAPLSYTQTVTTNIPDETGSTKQSVAPVLLGGDMQRMTVSIPGGVTSSGTQTIPVKGDGAEGGTLTVNWKFTRL
ncbi:MAG TPA: hypothetical protein VM146_03775 [Steroidobacteraceae bacterium]|nr:hypothetical protein [Steroidobacteraceae bacterium]